MSRSATQLSAVLALVLDEGRSLIDPYASPTTGELRISGRIHETGPASKDALIRDIERQPSRNSAPDAVHVTHTVLFNDMRALFTSQTSTLVRAHRHARDVRRAPCSVTLAVLGLVPNLLAPLAVLAFMGLSASRRHDDHHDRGHRHRYR